MATASDTDKHHLDQLDWEDIIYTLESGTCVLFLGAGVMEAPGGGNVEKALEQYLGLPDPSHPHVSSYNSDGFFVFKRDRHRRQIIGQIHDFYNQQFPETQALFAKLARLPFHVVFSLTPDNLLARTYNSLGLDYQVDFYYRLRNAPENFEEPTLERPLLYNLFGHVDDPESVMVTHQDFFDYLKSTFAGNSMHKDLKKRLNKKTERLIFLGLPYDKWYFQLVLRVLSTHLRDNDIKPFDRIALEQLTSEDVQAVYTKDFKIDFVPTNSKAFIDRLYSVCEEKGLLKKLPLVDPVGSKEEEVSIDEIRDLVSKAKAKEAMDTLVPQLKARRPRSADLLNQLYSLRSRYELLWQRERRGTLDSRDFNTENNDITDQLLELLTKSEAL